MNWRKSNWRKSNWRKVDRRKSNWKKKLKILLGKSYRWCDESDDDIVLSDIEIKDEEETKKKNNKKKQMETLGFLKFIKLIKIKTKKKNYKWIILNSYYNSGYVYCLLTPLYSMGHPSR
jgi:hypothetical protein